MTYRLENWAVRKYYRGSVWLAPEANPNCLEGDVYGHPKFPEGKAIKTSAIANCTGHIVTTEKGSVYELGQPNPKYLQWLKEQGIPFDPQQPIKQK